MPATSLPATARLAAFATVDAVEFTSAASSISSRRGGATSSGLRRSRTNSWQSSISISISSLRSGSRSSSGSDGYCHGGGRGIRCAWKQQEASGRGVGRRVQEQASRAQRPQQWCEERAGRARAALNAEGAAVTDESTDVQEDEFLTKALNTSDSSGSINADGPHADPLSSMEGKSLWRKLAQNVNVSGVSFSARVIVKDRRLAIPHVSVPDISWIDWKALRVKGFEGVVFDKDNTLTAPFGQSIWPPLSDSLQECREIFGGRIALLSNSAGLYQYDPHGAEAKLVEDRLGIPVIRHGQKKPAGNALTVSKYFSCDPSMLVMVGDRYFTDVVYGNSNGFLTIRPAPLTTIGEPFMVKRVRRVEETLVDWWSRRGCLPPKHRLFDNPVEFIKDPGCW